MVFVGSYDGNIYALNAFNGDLVWSYETGDMVVSSPSVANGVVYAGSYDHMVYAIGAWQGRPEPTASPSMALLLTASLIVLVAVTLLAIVLVYRRKRKV